MAEHKDGLRASISRWASQDRDEARELRKDRRKAGLVAISDAPDRQRVIVQGTLPGFCYADGMTGRIGVQDHQRVMYNPRYELRSP